ncbi:uncharacterized protein LOC117180533 [Belonocnema kinseyi]|uniref:uncharacterized protein LOC117180533 n=1 Tax=Belonocnema kinseyi TaxID=2817044 RepID=UPI00143CC4CC|nr:uncharacterized protein LOC117180533 [Belonocnema kinseyi]
MFKIASFYFLLFTIFSYVVTEETKDTYSDKYDYIDVDEILANPRMADTYYKCFMDLGPCITADQKFFRDFIPEVFATQCRKCTEKQKIMFDKTADHYSSKLPEKWEAVIKKYVIDRAGLGTDKKSMPIPAGQQKNYYWRENSSPLALTLKKCVKKKRERIGATLKLVDERSSTLACGEPSARKRGAGEAACVSYIRANACCWSTKGSPHVRAELFLQFTSLVHSQALPQQPLVKMYKNFVVLILFFSLTVCILSEKIELYSDKYDYVDIDQVLSNDRVRHQYYRCFLGTGPCLSPDAKFLKDKLPEALVTKCKKCTEKQKVGFEKVVLYYTEKEPEAWNHVLRKAVNDFKRPI